MQGKRFYSRGNVAIAALLFVTLVGVAAVALDSARPLTAPAQVAAAADAKVDGEKDQKCEKGYDYVVRYDEKTKEPTIKSTLPGDDKHQGLDNKAAGNQCKTEGQILNDGQGGTRKCDTTWKCQVWMCVPAKLTKGGTEEDCYQRSFDGKGETTNAIGKSVVDKDTFKASISEIVANTVTEADAKRAGEIGSAAKGYSGLSDGVLAAFGENRSTELPSEISQAKLDSAAALKAWQACMPDLSGFGCQIQEQNSKEADQKLAQLQKESQALKAFEASVAPGTNPDANKDSYNCPGGPNCGGGEWDKEKKTLIGEGGVDCNKNPTASGCRGSFPQPPPGNPGPGPGNTQASPSNSSGNASDLMKTLGQFAPLLGQLLGQALQGQNAPTCSLKASPVSVKQPGQPVTLSWTTQNAQQAYLSASGQVGPTGQITVNPQQTTSYTMQVTGYPQQMPQQQQQGQFVYNPYTSQYQYVQAQQQPAQQGAPQQGQCQVQVTVGQDSGGGGSSGSSDKPKAQISCQPKIADVGMSASISYACQNSSTSQGDGFSTDGKLSGSAAVDISSPEKGSTTITYGLTCGKDGTTDSAQCTVNVNKPSIVLVANPKDVKDGEKTNIGWVTGAMESCVIASPDLSGFTDENKNNTNTSGSVKTPPLTDDTKFVLTCTTKAGGTKTAETVVNVEN